MFARLTILLAGLSLLTGCGFHPRGNIALPPELARVYVTGTDRALVEQLSGALEQHGALVADSAHGAAVIDLAANHRERETLTTDSEGRATHYAVRYEVVFSVTSDGGAPLRAAQSISLQRAYEYDPGGHLQSEEEVRFLKTEMRREAVIQILRWLAHI